MNNTLIQGWLFHRKLTRNVLEKKYKEFLYFKNYNNAQVLYNHRKVYKRIWSLDV